MKFQVRTAPHIPTYIICYFRISEDLAKMERMVCKPVNKFGFLKTHKCGSTTIQNMLLRYVVKHDLNVVVPVESENFLRCSLS